MIWSLNPFAWWDFYANVRRYGWSRARQIRHDELVEAYLQRKKDADRN